MVSRKEDGIMLENLTLWQDRLSEDSPWKKDFLPLAEGQILQLHSQGNILRNSAQIFLAPGAEIKGILHSILQGPLWIFAGVSVYQSFVQESVLEEGVKISSCPQVRSSVLLRGTRLRGVEADCPEGSDLSLRRTISLGLEQGRRQLVLHPEHTLGTVEELQELGPVSMKLPVDFNVIGPEASLEGGGRFSGVYFAEGVRAQGCAEVRNCIVLSTLQEPSHLGPQVILRNSILQSGVVLDSGALVESSLLLEHSGAGRQARLSESVLGPNTEVAQGEVTASFLGPFVGFHHQSLLIAAWWPKGRGNVASGAQVGSNHTSRAPDQGIRIGEGVFFGLGTIIKFPAVWDEAPYSVVASGLTTLPQKVELPFSVLIARPTVLDGYSGGEAEENRIIPGWVLDQNTYALFRNEGKFLSRNTATQHEFDFRLFRHEIVEKLWKASEKLGELSGKPVYNSIDWLGLGQNILLESDRLKAIEVYREWIQYAALQAYIQGLLSGENHREEWPRFYFPKIGLDWANQTGNIRRYLDQRKKVMQKVLDSKLKDEKRGIQIESDYGDWHYLAREDGFIQALKEQIEKEEESLSLFL
jgi:hypothetical protein